jgi:CheY-like chemotaxis protein
LQEAQSGARVAAARPKRRPKGTGTPVQRTYSIKAGEAATVVVVDDDPSVLRALSRLIQAAGFRVLTFDRPSALLASATPRVNACMVVDINLPEMDGSELFSALAASGRREEDSPAVHTRLRARSGAPSRLHLSLDQ